MTDAAGTPVFRSAASRCSRPGSGPWNLGCTVGCGSGSGVFARRWHEFPAMNDGDDEGDEHCRYSAPESAILAGSAAQTATARGGKTIGMRRTSIRRWRKRRRMERCTRRPDPPERIAHREADHRAGRRAPRCSAARVELRRREPTRCRGEHRPARRARREFAIGKGNALPWRLSDDLKRFKALTLGKPLLMGARPPNRWVAPPGG